MCEVITIPTLPRPLHSSAGSHLRSGLTSVLWIDTCALGLPLCCGGRGAAQGRGQRRGGIPGARGCARARCAGARAARLRPSTAPYKKKGTEGRAKREAGSRERERRVREESEKREIILNGRVRNGVLGVNMHTWFDLRIACDGKAPPKTGPFLQKKKIEESPLFIISPVTFPPLRDASPSTLR